MTAEADFYAVLAGDAALAALVSDRIYPLAIAQGTPLPAVAYARTDTAYENTLGGSVALSRVRFAVQAWGEQVTDVEAIGDAIVAALAAVSVPPEGRFTVFDDEMGLYGLTVEFDWWG